MGLEIIQKTLTLAIEYVYSKGTCFKWWFYGLLPMVETSVSRFIHSLIKMPENDYETSN